MKASKFKTIFAVLLGAISMQASIATAAPNSEVKAPMPRTYDKYTTVAMNDDGRVFSIPGKAATSVIINQGGNNNVTIPSKCVFSNSSHLREHQFTQDADRVIESVRRSNGRLVDSLLVCFSQGAEYPIKSYDPPEMERMRLEQDDGMINFGQHYYKTVRMAPNSFMIFIGKVTLPGMTLEQAEEFLKPKNQ